MGCGASSPVATAASGEETVQRSPIARMDTKQMQAEVGEFSGWQDDTFSPAVRAAKASRQSGENPNDISASREDVPAAEKQKARNNA